MLSDTHEYFDVVVLYNYNVFEGVGRGREGRKRGRGGGEREKEINTSPPPCLQDISKQASEAQRQERMLSILKSVGPAGFILLEPECRLILESKHN